MPEVAGFNPALARAAWGTARQQGAGPVCLHGCCSEPGGPWCLEEWLLRPFPLPAAPCHVTSETVPHPCPARSGPFCSLCQLLSCSSGILTVPCSAQALSSLCWGLEGAHFPASLLYAGVTRCRQGLRAARGSSIVPVLCQTRGQFAGGGGGADTRPLTRAPASVSVSGRAGVLGEAWWSWIALCLAEARFRKVRILFDCSESRNTA